MLIEVLQLIFISLDFKNDCRASEQRLEDVNWLQTRNLFRMGEIIMTIVIYDRIDSKIVFCFAILVWAEKNLIISELSLYFNVAPVCLCFVLPLCKSVCLFVCLFVCDCDYFHVYKKHRKKQKYVWHISENSWMCSKFENEVYSYENSKYKNTKEWRVNVSDDITESTH